MQHLKMVLFAIFLIVTEQAHIAEMVKTGQNVPDENTRRVKHLIDIFSVTLAQVDPIEMRPYLQCLRARSQFPVSGLPGRARGGRRRLWARDSAGKIFE